MRIYVSIHQLPFDSTYNCSGIVYTDNNLQSRYIIFYESCNCFTELFCIKELS